MKLQAKRNYRTKERMIFLETRLTDKFSGKRYQRNEKPAERGMNYKRERKRLQKILIPISNSREAIEVKDRGYTN